MSTLFKATVFLYEAQAQGGWSEGYWIVAAGYPEAAATCDSINTLRMGLTIAEIHSFRIRVSDPTIRGDAYLFTPTAENGTYPSDPGIAPIGAALLLRQSAASLYFANRFLRALPQSCVSNGIYAPFPGFVTALTAYMNALQGQTYIRAKPKPGGGPLQPFPVDDVLQEGLRIRKVGRPFGLPRGRVLIH